MWPLRGWVWYRSLVGVVLAVVGVVLGIAGVDPEPWVWYMGLVDVVHGIDRWA